jgi:uncharacterized membrane protein YphA (DoxX/SURF4 family)
MFIAYIIVAILMSALAVASGTGKLQHHPRIVSSIHGVIGVPMPWIPVLAACEIAGALGLLIGIFWPPLGLVAAVGLVAYFVGAVVAHLRVRDFKSVGNPLLPLVLAVATLVLRILSI